MAPTGTERFTWETYIMTSEHEPLAPREELLCRLFAEVLKRPEVSADEGFFALGGDSISAVGLVGLAREAGLEFTRREIFLHPSPAQLAAVVREVAPPEESTADSHGEEAGSGAADTPLISLSQAELDDIERQLG
ncbi:phosphopantetheine-binding protein [Streptomyces sp. NPDC017979]|uniref:phosphopantetheine-binding protein n=1 Tax=Streptomyces sp. NPDC017979 TaxID=3365024 RepID=UPI0037A03892